MNRRNFLYLISALGILQNTQIGRSDELSTLENKLSTQRWMCYTPTQMYNPGATTQSISEDLDVLINNCVQGIVTYGSENVLKDVPKIANEKGLDVIMGIWDIRRGTARGDEEYNNAITAQPYVAGYCAGNEQLGKPSPMYDLPTLQTYISDLKNATGKPVTTTEEWGDYNDPALINTGDWIFCNTHPFWAGITNAAIAASWTENLYLDLKIRAPGKLVVFKEVGYPTQGNPDLSEQLQKDYYELLKTTQTKFVNFEGFDQWWKFGSVVEPYWGFFDKDRNPKLAVSTLCPNAVKEWKDYE